VKFLEIYDTHALMHGLRPDINDVLAVHYINGDELIPFLKSGVVEIGTGLYNTGHMAYLNIQETLQKGIAVWGGTPVSTL